MKTDFMIERDTIMTLGILARAYVDFDPPISTAPKAPHTTGFNVHCLVLDNRDGEVLAVARNRIFAESDPLQHAEQGGIRLAMARLKAKRPRPARMTVVEYYKGELFMQPGTTDADFAFKGCTLYNTFDPCGFCATTSLVCYMKRIAYVFEDKKFSGVYDLMKTQYFTNRDSIKEPTATSANAKGFIGPAGQLVADLRKKVHDLEEDGTDLVLTLDRCREDLAKASSMLANLGPDSLQTTGDEAKYNLKTLTDVQRLVLGM
jgi:tRNA(Arg) A34 adenosine deaminase TadA